MQLRAQSGSTALDKAKTAPRGAPRVSSGDRSHTLGSWAESVFVRRLPYLLRRALLPYDLRARWTL